MKVYPEVEGHAADAHLYAFHDQVQRHDSSHDQHGRAGGDERPVCGGGCVSLEVSVAGAAHVHRKEAQPVADHLLEAGQPEALRSDIRAGDSVRAFPISRRKCDVMANGQRVHVCETDTAREQ